MQIDITTKQFKEMFDDYIAYDISTEQFCDLIIKLLKLYNQFDNASFHKIKQLVDRFYKHEI